MVLSELLFAMTLAACGKKRKDYWGRTGGGQKKAGLRLGEIEH